MVRARRRMNTRLRRRATAGKEKANDGWRRGNEAMRLYEKKRGQTALIARRSGRCRQKPRGGRGVKSAAQAPNRIRCD